MSYLESNNSYLSTRLTNIGRRRISEGNFNIKYFQIGDSEYNYDFDTLSGSTQKVLTPFDVDGKIKYPYLLTSGSTIDFGLAIQQSTNNIVTEKVGNAGVIDTYNINGTEVLSSVYEISNSKIDGSNILVLSGTTFEIDNFITIYFGELLGSTPTILNKSNSLTYQIVDIVNDEIYLDRNMPDFSSIIGNSSVIKNNQRIDTYSEFLECPVKPVPINQNHDAWKIEIVYKNKPIGTSLDLNTLRTTKFNSTLELLGYNSQGQVCVNQNNNNIEYQSFSEYNGIHFRSNDEIDSVAILHFTEKSNYNDEDRGFRYDDFLSIDDSNYQDFQIFIPFILYHRSDNQQGILLKVSDITPFLLKSNISGAFIPFIYLTDENGNNVGKIFYTKKLVVIDDPEIVGVLDFKNNRRYTLPSPELLMLPNNIFYNTITGNTLLNSGQSIWVSYLLTNSDDSLNGIHCKYIKKITSSFDSNLGFKLPKEELRHLNSGNTTTFSSNKLYILVNIDDSTKQPTDYWTIIDVTDQIPNYVSGSTLTKEMIGDIQFIITKDMYDNGETYYLDNYMNMNNNTNFGDEQYFFGGLQTHRGVEIENMTFLVNLPSTQFLKTQNPTYNNNVPKITEVTLLNDKRETVCISKLTKPLSRSGTQIIEISIDF